MKKIVFTLLLALSIITLSPQQVSASRAPYHWIVNGETLNYDSTNTSQTAEYKTESIDGNEVGVLTLKNYNGGQIKLECYGTGTGQVMPIKLVGNNTITVEDGIGLLSSNEIEFIGTGTLTIKAKMPLKRTYDSYVSNTNKIITLKITGKDKQDQELTTNETQENNTTTTSTENNDIDKETILLITSISSMMLLVILIILVTATYNNKQKKKN